MTLGINVSGQARPGDDGATKKRAHEARGASNIHASEILDRVDRARRALDDVVEAVRDDDPASAREGWRAVSQESHHGHERSQRWLEANGRQP